MEQEFIKKELAKYNITDVALAKLKKEYLPLKVNGIDDMDNYLLCRDAHQKVQKLRTSVEPKRKELKADSLEYGRKIDTEAKRIVEALTPIENHLKDQRAVVEDEKKRIQAEKERKEKEEQERLRREEEARLEAVRGEQEEKERKLQEEREKIEAEKRAIEDEKLQMAAEKAAKEKAEMEERDRIEREKRHAEEVERAKEEAVRKEQIRKEEEENAKIEAKRKVEVEAEHAKLIAPDKDKILAYGDDLQAVLVPQTNTEEAMEIVASVRNKIMDVVDFLRAEASKL